MFSFNKRRKQISEKRTLLRTWEADAGLLVKISIAGAKKELKREGRQKKLKKSQQEKVAENSATWEAPVIISSAGANYSCPLVQVFTQTRFKIIYGPAQKCLPRKHFSSHIQIHHQCLSKGT